MPTTTQKPGAGIAGPGLNELTIRREGSRALTPEQERAYVLLCACADRLRGHDLAAVEVMHARVCTMNAVHNGVPVVVAAAYDLVETVLRNEIVDSGGECTCWLSVARRALGIRNIVSQGMLVHALLSVCGHRLVAAEVRRQVRGEFGARRAGTAPKAMTTSVASMASMPELVDAAVVGGVMVVAMIQDTLAMAGMGPFMHG
ncbi:MAG TPA: hypothetical protein VI248_27175 [Kineosporiaceae bacterium]